ncbi:MAG: hypothetical protein DHS20C17_24380 [Cyclobacteriaceae bacterium]|nr:MAG: hypothetical protein DHS20C17_24380 [Cyclobacteriaceae bacterium]
MATKQANFRFLLIGIIFLIWSCSGDKSLNDHKNLDLTPSGLSGSELAKIHCGGCHALVAPELLSKSSWKEDVLPYMGFRLGIHSENPAPDSIFGLAMGDTILKKAGIPETPVIASEDWNKIVDYFITNAPDTILPPTRHTPIAVGLKHFVYKRTLYSLQPPNTSMVKILPENRGIVFGDGKRNIKKLTFLTPELRMDYDLTFGKVPIHYYEKSDTVYLTTIGESIYPDDTPGGVLQKLFKQERDQGYNTTDLLIPDLQRPVFMAYGDLNNDGTEDIVSCEFGNLTGKLVWFNNLGGNKYSKHVLRDQPGVVTAIIKDLDQDGHRDIIALAAQGDEGVFFYKNNGDNSFTESRLLTFSPLFGSQYIELADFNNDGFEDIIYSCGDNADKTPILKSFHGVYIFLNDGNLRFSQAYFYQLNGAYKAIPRDFDLDGDLDIAAISFFPDYYSYPEEGFVYLENRGGFEFTDYTFRESINGRWMVMDAADMDTDGDIDIVLGSNVSFKTKNDTTGLSARWAAIGPSVIVLENTIR